METISKKQLVDQIAAKTDATKTDINTILDAYIDVAMLLKATRYN